MPSSSRAGGERSLKKASADAQRRAMTERRHEYAARIRKAKKSHVVTLKRRYVPATTAATPAASTISLEQLAWNYIQLKSTDSLSALQSALATSSDMTIVFEQDKIPNEDAPAMQLANTLAYSLSQPDEQVKVLASRVLTNLAAMEQKDDETTGSYYGRQPEGWCAVLIRSHALQALIEVLQKFVVEVDPSYMPSDGPVLEVCQQTCWAIGNLAGDSQLARDIARQAGVVQPLCTVLQKGMELKHTSICRNSAWALSNLTRGVTTSGKEFCAPSLLTPSLVASVLMSPEQQLSTTVVSLWWTDVANEMCWVLAFLTAREDEVVDFLCQPTTKLAWLLPRTMNVVCAALSHRLEQASKIVRKSTTKLSDTALRALRMTIPCLRSIGNIATACQGKHVLTLLQDTTILDSLVLLIEAGFSVPNGDVASVSVEAAWAAGTILCDYGLPDHPSTTHVGPALVPVLCQAAVSEHAKLDLKRESLTALWNAVELPPSSVQLDFMQWAASLPIRNLLQQVASVPGMVFSLTELLLSPDADAVFMSIQMINALVRVSVVAPTTLMEVNIVDALDAVCDRASEDHSYGGGREWQENPGISSRCADIAADLIDDFFCIDVEDAAISMGSSSDGATTFSFVPPNAQQTVFDFSGPQQQS